MPNIDLLEYVNEHRKEYSGQMTFEPSFGFWFNYLLEKLVRIFEWTGLPFDQISLELPTMTDGYSGFEDDPKAGFMCAPGGLSGPTWSPLVYTHFTYAAPTAQGGQRTIYTPYTASGRLGNCVLINNTSLRTSIIPLVDRYATLLAHEDLNIVNTGLNMRYDTVFTAETDATVESIKSWRKKLFRGIFAPIVDKSLSNAPIVVPSSTTNKGQAHKDAIESRQELLRMFFAEVGVRMSREKKGNLIAAEVQQDDQMLLFNIADMLKQRQTAAQQISERFDLEVTVKLSPEFQTIEDESFDGDN